MPSLALDKVKMLKTNNRKEVPLKISSLLGYDGELLVNK